MDRKARGVLALVTGPERLAIQVTVEAARRCRGEERVVFPRRVVSGPPVELGEVHQTVSPAQFQELRRNGVFGLVWGAGGRNYALPASISEDLRAGRAVVAAGSAAAVRTALRAVPHVVVAVAGASLDPVTRRMYSGCEEVVQLGPEPGPAAAQLVELLDELVGVARPVERAAVPWVGGGLA